MMDYEAFKREVENKFKDYLPADAELKFHQVDKINATLDAVSIINEENRGSVSPTIYIEDMYSEYTVFDDLEDTFRVCAHRMLRAMKYHHDALEKGDIKDNIVFQLINTEQNQRILSRCPSRAFLDLSVIYRWIVCMDDDATESAIIDNGLAEYLGLTEVQLFELAMENTRRLFPIEIAAADDIVRENAPEMLEEMNIEDMAAEDRMWVLTNCSKRNGAACILYEEELYAFACKVGVDFYIMPSSLHEVMLMPAGEMTDPEFLADTVTAVNADGLVPEERLSNNVYYYSRSLRRLTLATDRPSESLRKGRKDIWE